jgi:hypothetical protein
VTLEIFDRANQLVRRFASTDKPEPVNEKQLDIPTYWIRPTQILSAKAGMQRFVWDLHYPAPPRTGRREYPIAAVYRDTPSEPRGPLVLPGEYTVKLSINGHSLTQPLTVKMDPRVKTPADVLAQQFAIALRCWDGARQAQTALAQVRKFRAELKARKGRAGKGPVADAIAALDQKAEALEGKPLPRFWMFTAEGAAAASETNLRKLASELTFVMELVDGADVQPTTQAVAAAEKLQRSLADLLGRWQALKGREVAALNNQLRKDHLPAVSP